MPPGNVYIAPRPTDCDFLRAPIGTKGCRYEREVFGNLSSEVAYDAQIGLVINRKTGEQSKLDPHADMQSVTVLWTRKTDK